MKRLIYLPFLFIGLLFITTSPLNAQTNDQRAESFYRAGQYAQALSLYEQDLKIYPNNPYLYYNIGNCYFKMGSKGLAAAYYYRAFKLKPQDSDIRHNLALTLQQSGDSLVPRAMPPALHRAIFALSFAQLKGLLCLAGWLVCLLAGCWLLTRKGATLTIVTGGVFLLVAGWYYIRYSWEQEPLAVVAAPVVELRSGPGSNFPASASVQQGHLVQVLDSKDNWQEVIVRSEGLKGWMEQNALERI